MASSRLRRTMMLAGLVVMVGGCATSQGLDTVPASFLLRTAYVTNTTVNTGTFFGQKWEEVVPPRRTELDPAKDSTGVFVMVFSSPEALAYRGTLKSPGGAVWSTFDRK